MEGRVRLPVQRVLGQGADILGRHWPPDTPEQSFKPIPSPPRLITPYFDPHVRLPLYQAAFGRSQKDHEKFLRFDVGSIEASVSAAGQITLQVMPRSAHSRAAVRVTARRLAMVSPHSARPRIPGRIWALR